MSLVTVLLIVALIVLLPGFVVDLISVRFAVKDTGWGYLWGVLNPISLAAMLLFGYAALTISFYFLAFSGETNRVKMFKNLKKDGNQDSIYMVNALEWIFRRNKNSNNN